MLFISGGDSTPAGGASPARQLLKKQLSMAPCKGLMSGLKSFRKNRMGLKLPSGPSSKPGEGEEEVDISASPGSGPEMPPTPIRKAREFRV